jgi:prolipoprotein diacylglyceryltransferase
MQFFIIILIICAVLFLFRLYHLANDDYILAKRNLSLEDVFNAAFVTFAISLLFSRLFYVLLNPEPIFRNILGFILFPYFPGLSSTGALIGGIVSLFLFNRYKKLPLARVFDFFSVAFIFVLPLGMVGYFFLSQDFSPGNFVRLTLYTLLLVGSNIYLYPKASSLELKDGTISAIFLVFFSLISLLTTAINNPGVNYFISHRENFILFAILLISMGIIIRQEIIGRTSIRGGK